MKDVSVECGDSTRYSRWLHPSPPPHAGDAVDGDTAARVVCCWLRLITGGDYSCNGGATLRHGDLRLTQWRARHGRLDGAMSSSTNEWKQRDARDVSLSNVSLSNVSVDPVVVSNQLRKGAADAMLL